MTDPAGGREFRLLLDEQTARSLVSILTDLTGFFDDCSGPVADAVNGYFDDLSAADWIPIVLHEHIFVFASALSDAIATHCGEAHKPLPAAFASQSQAR